MAKSGLAKGANKGHITDAKERVARPSQSKGVSFYRGLIVVQRKELLEQHECSVLWAMEMELALHHSICHSSH